MHVIFINYHYNPKITNPQEYFEYNKDKVKFYTDIVQSGIDQVSVIQRAPYSNKVELSGIRYYFIKDEFNAELRWCEKPIKLHTTVAALEPDIVHIAGLDLPIHYRWVRKTIGNKVILIGQHTGEKKWLQRILWLQQFGLRVVDGFIFKNNTDANPWLKAAVILSKQPVYKISGISQYTKKAADQLVKMYKELS